jgi:eukaryotic-like serine/threonine-protein kinase
MTERERPSIRDRWVGIELLASGTAGEVWRGVDRVLARDVSLRIMPAVRVDDASGTYLHRRLAVAAQLEHENVAVLYDAFVADAGVVLVGELVEGPTLRELGDELAPLPAQVVAAIGVQLALGLGAIHAAGAVHRALTPDRVRVAHDGTVKILGLGAARLLVDREATPAASVLEPTYLAPEQLDLTVPSDARADIYALGAVLWELTTGQVPFGEDGGTVELVRRSGDDPPPPTCSTTSVPEVLAATIARATRSDPDRRWPHARSVAEALLQLCTARPPTILRTYFAELLAPPPAILSRLGDATTAAANSPEVG